MNFQQELSKYDAQQMLKDLLSEFEKEEIKNESPKETPMFGMSEEDLLSASNQMMPQEPQIDWGTSIDTFVPPTMEEPVMEAPQALESPFAGILNQHQSPVSQNPMIQDNIDWNTPLDTYMPQEEMINANSLKKLAVDLEEDEDFYSKRDAAEAMLEKIAAKVMDPQNPLTQEEGMRMFQEQFVKYLNKGK